MFLSDKFLWQLILHWWGFCHSYFKPTTFHHLNKPMICACKNINRKMYPYRKHRYYKHFNRGWQCTFDKDRDRPRNEWNGTGGSERDSRSSKSISANSEVDNERLIPERRFVIPLARGGGGKKGKTDQSSKHI